MLRTFRRNSLYLRRTQRSDCCLRNLGYIKFLYLLHETNAVGCLGESDDKMDVNFQCVGILCRNNAYVTGRCENGHATNGTCLGYSHIYWFARLMVEDTRVKLTAPISDLSSTNRTHHTSLTILNEQVSK